MAISKSRFGSIAVRSITLFCGGHGNETNCVAGKSLQQFIEGDHFLRIPGFQEMPGNYPKLPDKHGDHFDRMKNGEDLIITFLLWNLTCLWRPHAAYELFVVAASDESILSTEKMRTEWLQESTVEDIRTAMEFLKLMLGKVLADQLGSKEIQ
jgi:hypothetical protein